MPLKLLSYAAQCHGTTMHLGGSWDEDATGWQRCKWNALRQKSCLRHVYLRHKGSDKACTSIHLPVRDLESCIFFVKLAENLFSLWFFSVLQMALRRPLDLYTDLELLFFFPQIVKLNMINILSSTLYRYMYMYYMKRKTLQVKSRTTKCWAEQVRVSARRHRQWTSMVKFCEWLNYLDLHFCFKS